VQFDEIVSAHSTADRAEQIFANPFYQSLSSSFAGTQEYMAMEKLSQLRALDEWDLIVVDTPPSRSALDFLDAPKRLGRFLDGRMLRLLNGKGKKASAQYFAFSPDCRLLAGASYDDFGIWSLPPLTWYFSFEGPKIRSWPWPE
jgi:anion-transporting  ArsA/GET3 family ATPase